MRGKKKGEKQSFDRLLPILNLLLNLYRIFLESHK